MGDRDDVGDQHVFEKEKSCECGEMLGKEGCVWEVRAGH